MTNYGGPMGNVGPYWLMNKMDLKAIGQSYPIGFQSQECQKRHNWFYITNESLHTNSFPKDVRNVIFMVDVRFDISNIIFPSSIQTIKFNDFFNQNINKLNLLSGQSNLKNLYIGSRFNQPLYTYYLLNLFLDNDYHKQKIDANNRCYINKYNLHKRQQTLCDSLL